MTSIATISVNELSELCSKGDAVEVIDVRTPAEFQSVHCVHARNVPLESLDATAAWSKRTGSEDSPLYVICKSGGRSHKACEAFVKAGFSKVVNVAGGTDAWDQAGLAVNCGSQQRMSLERQVRIAAGFLVFLGAVLGYYVDPKFIGISGFVGAGLMFAGITDTCAMGMIIARMPWNQV